MTPAPSAQYHAPDSLSGRTLLLHAEIVDGHLHVRKLGPGGWRESWPVAIARGLALEWPGGTCDHALRALGVARG